MPLIREVINTAQM